MLEKPQHSPFQVTGHVKTLIQKDFLPNVCPRKEINSFHTVTSDAD